MIPSVFTDSFAEKSKYVALFLILCVFATAFGFADKKETQSSAEHREIDPLNEKALDFLDLDYEQLRQQAGQLAGEKKYLEAAQCYLSLLKFNQNDSTSIYNLACCYGRLRKPELAVKSLFMAVRAGFRDFLHLRTDPDFTAIRDAPEFMNLLDRIPGWEDRRGEVSYVKSSRLAELLVKTPPKFTSARPYPLLIGLHGNGGNSEQMLAAMIDGLQKEPVILAAPQGAYANFPQLRGLHFSWEIQTRNRELWKIGDPLVIENINEVVQLLMRKYPISEVYILGFSQGAAYAFLTGFTYPERVAGIISIGGLFPETDTEFSMLTEAGIASGKKFRIFIAQGRDDRSLPIGLGVKTAEKLRKYGYEVEYQEYEGGHEIKPELLKNICSWMAKR
jgi:phospholipase/carboxylesterase